MQTSVLGSKSVRLQHGLSLLEIIVVLLIIGISATAGIRYMPKSNTNSLYQDARQLSQRFELARQYALQHRESLSWQVQGEHYDFRPIQPQAATLPVQLRQTTWHSRLPVQVEQQPKAQVLVEAAWLHSPLSIILDNGVDRITLSRTPYGQFEIMP